MRANQYAVLAIVALALVALYASNSAAAAATEDGKAALQSSVMPDKQASFKPAKLFDFSNFKKLFKKSYRGLREELVRKKYFLARAFRAYISSIKYKYRKSTFYLAINDMSDWTPKEIRMSRNEVLSERIKEELKRLGQRVARKFQRELPEALPEDADETEKVLSGLAEAEAKSTDAANDEDVRALPMEKLIHANVEGAQLSPEVARKLKKSVPSNNPNYEPLDVASYGLIDEQVEIDEYWVEPTDSMLRWCAINFQDSAAAATSRARGGRRGGSSQLPDVVFADLRQTECFMPPRQQGTCGACYAFTAIAMFEFMYCKAYGSMAIFSEQYMIDCGFAYVDGLDGCNGGNDYAAAQFIRNFGLELRQKYPYFMQVNECPYHVETDMQSVGYMRFDFTDIAKIPMEAWPYFLEEAPITAGMAWEAMFHEYGDGVFGWGCNQEEGAHAVVIVGYGRESGHQYWLIRNSFGIHWGDGGYGKLAKAANCINPQYGYVYATGDGATRELQISANENHDPSIVRNFVRNLRRG